MGLINVPELTIYNALDITLKYLRDDYNNASDKNNSILYQLVGGLSIGKYDLFTQAKNIFIDEVDNPRAITLSLAYNMKLESFPAIFIDMPSESNGQQTIGEGEGAVGVFTSIQEDFTQPIYTKWYQSTYRITITSDNSNEVVLIYHVLKAMLASLYFHLNQLGLKNLTLGGGDLQINGLPGNIFYRVITFNVLYESSTVGLSKYPILNKLVIENGKPVNEL